MSSTIKLRCLDNDGNSIFVVDSLQGIYGSNTQASSNSTTGGLIINGGLSISKTSNATSATNGGSLTVAGGASFARDVYVGGALASNELSISSTTAALNSTTGAMLSKGGISIQSTQNSSSVTNGGGLLVMGGASIGKDLYVGGSLTVFGTQTNVVSETLNIGDNLLVINSGPSATRDAGILIQRFQTENDTGIGDVVADVPVFSATITTASSTTAIFDTTASSSDDTYTNWYIKLTSGLGIYQVRKIVSYTGVTRTAIVNTAWTTEPVAGDTVDFYNRVYASHFYNETTDRFSLGFTSDDPSSNVVTVREHIGVEMGSIYVQSTQNAVGVGSGGSLTVLGGASVSNTLYTGADIYVSGGDITLNDKQAPTLKLKSSSDNSTNAGELIFVENNDSNGFKIRHNASGSDSLDFVRLYNSVGSTALTISGVDNGRIGINNTTPNYRLDINGDVRIMNGSLLATYHANTVGSIFTTGGNVGIANTNPTTRLDVAGGINATFYTGGNLSLSTSITTGVLVARTLVTSTNIVASDITTTSLIVTDSSMIGNVYTTGGNVGIGIVSPSYTLDVNGSTNVNGDLYVSGVINGSGSTSSTFAYLTLTATDESTDVNSGALVSVGGVTIQSNVDAESLSNGGSFLTAGGASITKRLFVGQGLLSSHNSNTLGSLYTTGGNVGIGTTDPGASLHVLSNGGAHILEGTDHIFLELYPNGYSTGRKALVGYGSAGEKTLTIRNEWTSGSTVLANDVGGSIQLTNYQTVALTATGGNIGIGTTSPVARLHVSSSSTAGTTQPLFVRQFSSNQVIAGLYGAGGGGNRYHIDMGSYHNGTIGTARMTFIDDNSFSADWAFSLKPSGSDGPSLTERLRITTSGLIGIGTTSPNHMLHLTGTQLIDSTQSVTNNNPSSLTGGALNVSGDIIVSGTRGVFFTAHGIGVPSFSSRSLGSKVVLYPSLAETNGDYAIGVESGSAWFSSPSHDTGFKFYQGTSANVVISANGACNLNSTVNSVGVGSGGALTVSGGGSIVKDLYIGGNLYVAGQNVSTISGSANVGSHNGSGVYTFSNISIGRTMGNTSYKVFGNVKSTTNNTNVYAVSFTNLTTTSFNVNIYRIDALGSGWSDANLSLSWQIIP
jgi:hypothetical protein